MVTRANFGSRHLSNGDCNSLALGGHNDDLTVDINVAVVAEDARDHQLGSVADGVDGRVLDDDAWEAHQKGLQRQDRSAQVRLVLVMFIPPLGVQNVVHRHQVVVLSHAS